MRSSKLSRAATAVVCVALLCVHGMEAEELADFPLADPISVAGTTPVAEPVSDAEKTFTTERASEGEGIPAARPVPIAERVPRADPVPVAEPVFEAGEDSAPAPVPEMIAAPGTAPTAEPVPVAETAPDPKMVPVAEPTATEEPDPAGVPESSVEMIPLPEPGFGVESILATKTTPGAETNPYTEEILALGPPWIAPGEDRMTLREMFLRSHREQLEIYDLDHDNQISEEEWKAANEDDLARGEKFFVVDKNEDGEIDENEAVGFLMERVSLSSTYLDATSDENADITRGDIKEHAPSELRVTLFSIPLGD